MKKLNVLVEALALATCIVAVIFINPVTVEMMVAASQAANRPEQSAIRKIVIFAQAVGNVAMLTTNPARPWARQQPAAKGGL
jgi:hypothetical protein